jgi:hypothetical protein
MGSRFKDAIKANKERPALATPTAITLKHEKRHAPAQDSSFWPARPQARFGCGARPVETPLRDTGVLTLPEAVEELRRLNLDVTYDVLWRFVSAGAVPAGVVGRTWAIRRDDLLAVKDYIATHRRRRRSSAPATQTAA